MKLNTDIIYNDLVLSVSAELSGVRKKELHLRRPEYYTDSSKVFLADHLYVVRADKLTPKTAAEPGTAIVCIGDSVYLPYYRQRCSVIQIREKTDCFQIFNILTEIYNKYDLWSETLQQILNTSASLQEMIACSQTIFGNPIFILNANLHYLARSDYSDIGLAEWESTVLRSAENGELPLPLFSKFLELHEMSTQVQEPMLINLLDSSTLNVNLFENNEYCGCLSIDYRLRPHRNSDNALAAHLARMVELALRKYTATANTEKSALRQALKDILDGLQVGLNQRRSIDTAQIDGSNVCIKIKFNEPLAQLPMGYLCHMIEHDIPGSIAFEYDGSIVCLIKADGLRDGSLLNQLIPLVHSVNFDIGVSDSFWNIYQARLYYLQACAALENGKLFAPEKRCYLFQEYALSELIINAIGNLPMEMYYPAGMQQLIKHDEISPVSYIDTLRTYLNNNMSITKTAADLYINRSTLLERISRIKRELGLDLQDSDVRLQLQILLKAAGLNEQLQR
ncbi:MAG: helix-turn-helix domain-containing protein [Eubacteriales bacterium]|nr:helix-turn-helix domain-containing protein [Eubacteriales bacterium]